MSGLWFEDELLPSPDAIRMQIRGVGEQGITAQQLQELYGQARSVIRVYEPDARKLGPAQPVTGREGTLWRISLHFEFAPLSKELRFVFALCEAYLEGLQSGEPQPQVYDLYPQRLYEDEIPMASLKFDPSVKVAGIETSVGEIKTDMSIGRIAPVTTGFRGQDGRNPHWRLRQKKYPLVGVRDFFLAAEQPARCSGIRLRVRVEGTIQTYWGPIAVGPKRYVWDSRPSIVIQ
jgi:hypothetical protein